MSNNNEKNPEITNLSRLISYYRKLQGMSQEDLAKASGINLSSIKKYEANYRNPKIDQVERIAAALHISSLLLLEPNYSTVSDVLAIIDMFNNNGAVSFDYKKNKNGKIIPKSVKIKFSSDEMQEVIADYLELKEKVAEEIYESDSDTNLDVDKDTDAAKDTDATKPTKPEAIQVDFLINAPDMSTTIELIENNTDSLSAKLERMKKAKELYKLMINDTEINK